MEATSAGQARGERLHAMDYLEYAYLQQGDVQRAKGVVDLLKQLSGDSAEVKNQYAASAIPARYDLELSKWEDARDLTVNPSWSPTAQANLWMAKGIGAARSGDLKTAETAVAELAKLRDKLKQSNPQDTYWSDQIEVQRLEVNGWLAQAKGEIEDARSELNSAADLEDGMEKRPVTPGPIVPAREMLAELWLQQKHPDEALTEFESVLRTSPKRFNAVYGAAKSAASIESGATALIDSQQAALRYYRELMEIAGEHKQRPELKEAADFISAHSKSKVNEAVK
jgi:tetratricopeptide (TPR) repeat protein